MPGDKFSGQQLGATEHSAKIVAWTQSFLPGTGRDPADSGRVAGRTATRLEPLIILSVWNPLATQWPAGSESGHVLVPVRRRV